MISYLKGRILEKGPNFIILENQNIGYKVFVTPDMLQIPASNEVGLYTYMKVSDDGQSLFGLADFKSLQFFELLITVSGVGPKVALAILSSAKPDAVKQAIANQNAGVFTKIAGIGTKIAERIIVELKNKVGLSLGEASGSSEVFDALLALGYNQREARGVMQKVGAGLSTQEQLKQALQMLGKS
jgi:Holliday junction DNA helicase RuvA